MVQIDWLSVEAVLENRFIRNDVAENRVAREEVKHVAGLAAMILLHTC
jgi:hypothetical protein